MMSDSAERVQRTRERELSRTHVGPLAPRFDVDVVGVSFRPAYPGNLYQLEEAQFLAEDRGEPIAVVLIREPDNPHDPNAIGVHIPALGEMGDIGHIPRALAARLAVGLDAGEQWQGWVVQMKLDHDHPDRPGLRIKIERIS